MRERPYEIDGKIWISIARAAKLLRTNAVGVRKLMGEGKLDYRQTRANSRTFVVCHDDVMKLMPLEKAPSKKQPKLQRREFEPLRRQRGGLWIDHHLRLTLPRPAEDEKRRDE